MYKMYKVSWQLSVNIRKKALAELEVSQSSAIPREQKMTQGIVAVLMTCEVKTQKLWKICGFF